MLPSNDEIRRNLRRAMGAAAPRNDALRFARAVWCDEMPGFAFALFTLVWIVLSFASLAGPDLRPLEHQVMSHLHLMTMHMSNTAAILSRVGTVAGVARRGWDLIARDCA